MSRAFLPITRFLGTVGPKATPLRVQTDGSYTIAKARTAVLFYKGPWIYGYVGTYEDLLDSTEAEWQSVCNGIRDAGERTLQVENDNQDVIRSLQTRTRPKKDRHAWQFDEIMDLAKEFESLSVRWIPREQNMADHLFRTSESK